jgi:hypothetical protein
MNKLLGALVLMIATFCSAQLQMDRINVKGINSTGSNTFSASTFFKVAAGCQYVDASFPGGYSTIQAAITAAGSVGCVIITSGYAGSDSYTNPNNVVILDYRRIRDSVNVVRDYGAKGDFRFASNATVSNSSTTVTSATMNFNSTDVGKKVGVALGASSFTGMIAGVTNVTTATLSGTPSFNATANANIFISTDDGPAFQSALNTGRCVYVAAGFYGISSVTLPTNGCLWMENMGTVIEPLTPTQAEMIKVNGPSLASPTRFVLIHGGQQQTIFQMGTGTAGMRFLYGNNIAVDDHVINGLYDGIFVDNTVYTFLYQINSNASTHSDIWYQESDTTHGPYYGGPHVIQSSNFQSSTGVAAIWATDQASLKIIGSNTLGDANQGIHITQINSATDKPSDITLVGVTADACGSECLDISFVRQSNISDSWFSGGRTNTKDCVIANGLDSVAFANNKLFWCGANGFNFVNTNPSRKLTLTGNHSDSNVGMAYKFVGVTNSSIMGNEAQAVQYAGGTQGSLLQTYGFNEDATSSGNQFIGNQSTGAVTADFSLLGTNSYGFNSDGRGVFGGSGIVGLCFGGRTGSFPCLRYETATGLGIVKGDASAYLDLSVNRVLLNSGINAANLLISTTAPTIAGAGCGGSAASIANNNGTAAFTINVGTAPTSGGCTITLPTAANGWFLLRSRRYYQFHFRISSETSWGGKSNLGNASQLQRCSSCDRSNRE